jgi:hypothetical protein
MSVQIVINGENANEAIQELAALSAGIVGRGTQTQSAPETDVPKSERSAKISRSKPESVKSEPAVLEQDEDPVNNSVNEPAAAEEDGGNEPIPTDVELREIARNIGAKGPEAKAAIKDLLSKYGVQNITAVPDEKRIAFKRELEALA